MQVIATSMFVLGGKYLGLLQVDDMVWEKIKPYLIYVAAFTLGVMANMKVRGCRSGSHGGAGHHCAISRLSHCVLPSHAS